MGEGTHNAVQWVTHNECKLLKITTSLKDLHPSMDSEKICLVFKQKDT